MRDFFVGLDLGIKEKKTSAICILEKKDSKIFPKSSFCKKCQDVFGREVFRKLKPYLKETKVIAIDSPLTKGKGKGKMRLFEKFFSRKTFQEFKIKPVPPALIPKVCNFSFELKKKLEKEGFVLDINLIETSAKISGNFLDFSKISDFFEIKNFPCKTKNQKAALICAILAFLHSTFQTRYFGYKDGFLFLPKISLWKGFWIKNFYLAWKERPKLKYRYLVTNIFER